MAIVDKEKIDVHRDFKKLLLEIQLAYRLNPLNGKIEKSVPLWRITKTITNMFKSNPHLIKLIIEAKKNV